MNQSAICLSVVTLTLISALAGCISPLPKDNSIQLKNYIIKSHSRQTSAVKDAKPNVLNYKAEPLDFEKDEKRVKQLLEKYGPDLYKSEKIDLGNGLDGKKSQTIGLSLEQTIRRAVKHNLEVKIAQLAPAISQAQIIAAQAAFDTVFFSNYTLTRADQPQPATVISDTQSVALQERAGVTHNLETGIRKRLSTGGQLSLSTTMNYNENKSSVRTTPNPANLVSVTAQLTQPLMRNFGAQITRAQIMLNRNAHQRDVLNLYTQMLTTLGAVESAYWRLRFSLDQFAIRTALLQRTRATRNKVKERLALDGTPAQLSQANSLVHLRALDLIAAERQLRESSDELKRLMNDPQLPIAGEIVILPTDEPIDIPVTINLVDSILTALKKRPELKQALLSIDDTSIRQGVADNLRLPRLDLNLQLQYFGLNHNFSQAWKNLSGINYVNYVLGLQFEQPFGNREAEANHTQARLSRLAATLQYRNTANEIVASVKGALRALKSSYAGLQEARKAHLSAAENMRINDERQREFERQTPEFLLNQQLDSQARLAEAEIRYSQSILDYNISIIRLHQVQGTLFDHNKIQINLPKDMVRDLNPKKLPALTPFSPPQKNPVR